jgi:hypothetical protein
MRPTALRAALLDTNAPVFSSLDADRAVAIQDQADVRVVILALGGFSFLDMMVLIAVPLDHGSNHRNDAGEDASHAEESTARRSLPSIWLADFRSDCTAIDSQLGLASCRRP